MFIFLSRLGRLVVASTVIMAVTAIIGFNTLTTSLVASRTNGPHSTTGSSTLSLVLVNSTDGLPHWGQTVTFNVSTTATSQPNVTLSCYQNGDRVYSAWAGFYPSYSWPSSQNMVLSSQAWAGGGANCTATLSYFNGSKPITLPTLNFQVYQ